MDKKLEVKNLKISFRTQGGKVQAVRDISFDLYKGETLSIVGESGSGKSVTSKAIIGILAGNSIVEGGEILYDGQDLLKITEDEFHKLRGEKIAMIFQDPMSSLNPIMRVGKQITEAMIINGKAAQKTAKNAFNSKLKLLNEALDIASGVENKEACAKNAAECKEFDDFCIKANVLELEYNVCQEHAVDLNLAIENTLFLIEKNQKVDLYRALAKCKRELPLTEHVNVIVKDVVDSLLVKINELLSAGRKNIDKDKTVELLNEIKAAVETGINNQKPNFFRLGYYLHKNPEEKFEGKTIDEIDTICLEYLNENFMNDFLKDVAIGLETSDKISKEKKAIALAKLDEVVTVLSMDNFEKAVLNEKVKESIKLVIDAIDRLSLHKNSQEYCYKNAVKHAIKAYYAGVKNNPKAQAKHDKQQTKYDKLVAAGKTPSWKVVPAALIDLELAKNNILAIVTSLITEIKADIEKTIDYNSESVAMVDFFKDMASKAVYKITHQIAKAKALKLLEEVGIPEPQMRYKQYPFEFSGGMRQRIVIAIALSANPDILICDEPTTALDVTIQSQILELINKIKKERNLSVIFITHDLGVVANMADRIAVMYAGKIVEYGTAEDIFYDPRHPYTWALLSSMPDLDTKEKLEAIPGTPPNMIYPPKGDAFADRNKYAMEIDYEMQPPMFEVSETHFAATWLLHPSAPKVEPPKVITDRIERMKRKADEYGNKQE